MDKIVKQDPPVDFSESYSVERLNGKSAVITGGALGIGAGASEALAEAGVYVTIADLAEEAGKELAKKLTDKGLHAQFIKTDVTSWDQIVATFEAAIQFSPSKTVDIVIPNAGIASPGLHAWLSTTQIDESKPETATPPPPPQKVVDVNYHAVFNTVHAALWYFKNHSGNDPGYSKNIVLVSSMGGYSPMAHSPCYNSSKWGVRGLFWSLRASDNVLGEGKPRVRVNLLAPTWVKTNMTKGFMEYIKRNPGMAAVKVAEVSDVTDVILRYVTDESVNGRAAAIAANKKSFDLCDNPTGPGAGATLNDPKNQALFGYGPLAEKPKLEPEVAPPTAGAVATQEAPLVQNAAS